MKVRIFNPEGLHEFRNLWYDYKFNGLTMSISDELITSERYSMEIEKDFFVENTLFSSKYEAASYLSKQLDLAENKALYYNVGLWTWLSAFYFDQLAPKNSDGKRKPGEEARHLLQEPKNHQKYYRHLLAGPARIYTELGELGRIFLTGSLDKRGDLTEQLQAYQNIALNKEIIGVADKLYWDQKNMRLKRGSGSKGKGTPRRFVKVINQFELTFDLNSMNEAKIIELFPQNEFGSWLSK